MTTNMRGALFFRGYASATLDVVETVRTGRTATVTSINACNTDSSARTFSVYLGGFPLFDEQTIAAGETLQWHQDAQVLNEGSTIEVQASVAGVVAVHISGSVSS